MKPTLVYDGNCGFCRTWVDYWHRVTGDRIAYRPAQDLDAVKLQLPSGDELSGALAVFTALEVERPHWIWAYRSLPAFAWLSERSYRLVARLRSPLHLLTRALFGIPIPLGKYDVASAFFIRLIGIIYLAAFVSLAVQIVGLVGRQGVLPLDLYLSRASQFLGSGAPLALPSLFWLNSSDAALRTVCWAGAVCAVLTIAGIAQRPMLILMFGFYLSLVTGGQEFLGFQWDLLLLETGFLSIFIGYSKLVIWLFRWLLFRLMFFSGAVKLLSHDPVWHDLTALRYHFETQPLPTPLAWYAHHLPGSILWALTAGMFFVELVVPFLIFSPARLRKTGGLLLLGLQAGIALTGNYAFFNWLTMALCLFLFEDDVLPTWPSGIVRTRLPVRIRQSIAGALAVLILTVSGIYFLRTFRNFHRGDEILSTIAPYGLVNTYGLFAVMTTRRPEILVEGSDDGTSWKAYEFRYKPGDPMRPPPWVAPHQPRLDWQMWFAALGSYRENLWFLTFQLRLLESEPSVLRLLAYNPFPDHPPRLIRAMVYDYRFSGSGPQWWTRKLAGTYLRPLSLNDYENFPTRRSAAPSEVR